MSNSPTLEERLSYIEDYLDSPIVDPDEVVAGSPDDCSCGYCVDFADELVDHELVDPESEAALVASLVNGGLVEALRRLIDITQEGSDSDALEASNALLGFYLGLPKP